MFTTTRRHTSSMTSCVLAGFVIFISFASGYWSISTTRDVEHLLIHDSIGVLVATATPAGGDYHNHDSKGFGNGSGNGSGPIAQTSSTTNYGQLSLTLTAQTSSGVPSPPQPEEVAPRLELRLNLTSTPRTIIPNVNNVNIYDVQNFEGAVGSTSDCAPVAAAIMLGPSTMEVGGARILASFDTCVITDGTVLLNLPDERGIQLIAANIQGGQTTQSAIIPLQRIAPIKQGQVLFGADLDEHVTGPDPIRGDRATLNGNINALFLWNNSGHAADFNEEHGVAIDILFRR
jgi:hypothetical protein